MSDPLLPLGTSRCLCNACGRYFGGVGGFTAHQRHGEDGRTVCLDPETLGMIRSGPYWVRQAPDNLAMREPVAAPTGLPERGRKP